MATELQFHPAADLFPLMLGKEFDDLTADIKENGLLVPISVYEGKILDGRNRLRACLIAGVRPDYVRLDDEIDAVAYVLSANLHRRHLSASQRGMIGARARGMYDKLAKERQRRGRGKKIPEAERGCARDMAGAAVGVSGMTVDRASKILKKGIPELAKAVSDGKVRVELAAEITKLPEGIQEELVKFKGKDLRKAAKDAIKKGNDYKKPQKKPRRSDRGAVTSQNALKEIRDLVEGVLGAIDETRPQASFYIVRRRMKRLLEIIETLDP